MCVPAYFVSAGITERFNVGETRGKVKLLTRRKESNNIIRAIIFRFLRVNERIISNERDDSIRKTLGSRVGREKLIFGKMTRRKICIGCRGMFTIATGTSGLRR